MSNISRATKYRQLKRRLDADVDETTEPERSSAPQVECVPDCEYENVGDDIFSDCLDTSDEETQSSGSMANNQDSDSDYQEERLINSMHNPCLEASEDSVPLMLAKCATKFGISHSALLALLTILSLHTITQSPKRSKSTVPDYC